MAGPHIEILTDDTDLTPSVREALDRIDATFDLRRLDAKASPIHTRDMDARLILTRSAMSNGGRNLDRLCGWVRRHPCPTLFYSDGPGEPLRLPNFEDESVAVGSAACMSGDALAGHLSAMCTLGGAMASMRRQMSALQTREASLRLKVQRMGRDLEKAAGLQRDLLPAVLPEVNGLDIHTLYRPADAVSGDSYDVVRVAPSKVALTVADATGHGVAAGLLCASFLRSLRPGSGAEETDPNAEPAFILSDLNRRLCAADLSECLFVTAIHAVYHEDRAVVRWSRAGAPYPILIRRGADPVLLRSEGPAAGMIEEPRYETLETPLAPGDVLLFHTDGLHEALADSDREDGNATVMKSSWFTGLANRPLRRSLLDLDGILADRRAAGNRKDDTTIVALERRLDPVRPTVDPRHGADVGLAPTMV